MDKEIRSPNGSCRLKDGIMLKDLLVRGDTEFSLDLESMKDELDGSKLDSFDFEAFNQFVNTDSDKKEDVENIPPKMPFHKLKENMTIVTDDGKINKKIIKHGCGDVIPSEAIGYLHYNCYLEKQDIPFDSSYQRNKPLRVQLGAGMLYPGFEISLLTMKIQESSLFLVEPEYAFGMMGCPPRIPPNATLLLEIQLLKIVEGNEIENSDVPLEEKDSFYEVSSKAKKYHMLGNELHAKGNVFAAVDKYKKAENILLSCKMNSDEEEDLCRKLLLKVYINMCVCYNHPTFKSPERVCSTAKEAFYILPAKATKSAKLFFHLGKAQLTFQNFDKASYYLKKALAIEPSNEDVSDLLKEVEEKKKKYYQHEKLTYQKAFQSPKTSRKDVKPKIEFEETFRKQLNELVNNSTNKVNLPVGLTGIEKKLCQKISEEQGLKYQEVMIGGKTTIFVTR